MIFTISTQLYAEVIARLKEKIGAKGYFSGSLSFDHEGVFCRLVVSCFVYRREVALPEGTHHAIADLVPVWWEFHTLDEGGERLNDFSFNELRAQLRA